MSKSKKDLPDLTENEEKGLPSIEDIIVAKDKKYKGRVIKEASPEEEKNTDEAELFLLEDMEKFLKTVGYEEKKPTEEAAEKVSEEAYEEDDVKTYTSKKTKGKSEKKQKSESDSGTKVIGTVEAEDGSTKVLNRQKSEASAQTVSGETKHYNLGKLFSSKQKGNGRKINISSQILNDGYKESGDNLSEAEIEAKLKTKRKRFVDNFRVLAKPTQDKPILERISESGNVRTLADSIESENGKSLFDAVDKADREKSDRIVKKALQREKARENSEKAKELKKALKKNSKKKGVQIKVLLLLGALTLIFTLISSFYNPGGALEKIFGNGARIYSGVSLALFLVGSVTSFDVFKRAVEGLQNQKITSAFCTAVISVFVLLHSALALITGLNEESGFTLYCTFGIFVLGAEIYSQFLKERTLFRNLTVITRSEELIGLQRIDNKADADALAKQISQNDYPVIYYSAEVSAPENPTEIAEAGTSDERFLSFCTLASMGASLVLSVAAAILEKRFSLVATCFTGCMCLCIPTLARLVSELLHAKKVASIHSFGGVIMGTDACEEIEQSNAFVFDAQDIFEARVSKFRTVARSSFSQSDAVIFVASMLKDTSCLLSKSFLAFAKENKISVPEAENVQYEDGLGYSSWVVGRRVLVGNREMLQAHSIDCPSAEEEAKYSKGRSVMYLAVEGEIAATFLVSYIVKGEVKKSVSSFKNTGIIIMFTASDPCLSEEAAASKLSLDTSAVKLVASPGREIVTAYKKHGDDRVDNGLLCAKKSKNILALASAAHALCSAKKISRVIYFIGVIVNFVFLAFCSLFGISAAFSSLSIIVIHCLWCAVSYYIGKARLR